MESKKIVITGGPGTGKTSIIKELEQSGFHCFHEIIRSMTLKAKQEGDPNTFISNPLTFVSDPFEFNKQLLTGRLEQYKMGNEINAESIFYDRAIPDVLAYMNHFDQAYGDDFLEICKSHIYDKIFLLPPWKSIYISDNERLEDFEEALKIHDHLEMTYQNLGYDVIEVPIGKVSERIHFILEKIK